MTESPSHHRLPPDVREVLDNLRGRIRRYVLIEGVSLVVVVLAGLFWASYLTDWAYFRISRLELPGWLRSAFLIVMVCCFVGGILAWIVARLMRRIRSRALALVLEKRFPELDDRLITAVELAENGEGDDSPLRSAMQQRTITDAARTARGLDLASVFDRRPLRRAVVAAALFAASIAGLSIADAAGMHRWYSAFVLRQDNYWDPFRRSSLVVGVVSQPGDRLKSLSTDDVYRHPRGADLIVRVDVPEGKEVPEQVTLHYRTVGETGSTRGRVTMTQVGDRTFRHSLARAMDDHQLHVVGGDFTNRLPYRIEIVDPPRIDAITLDCDYPAYTGMDTFADQSLTVQGTQVSLPVGTAFTLEAETNKPITAVKLRAQGANYSFAGKALSSDGRRFTIPMRLATREEAASLSTSDATSDASMSGNSPLLIPPDVPLQFELHDADDIRSAEPIRLTINGIVDLPPVVETRLKGIGRSITRLARIPVEGTITDDYGVATASFGHRVDEQAEYASTPLEFRPSGQKEFRLGEAGDAETEPFNVRPLELSLGQKLILTVFATDADNVAGPHESHGEVYSFTVVSNDELLAILYDKELNLRLRFEQIISEVQEARDDLAAHHELSLEDRRLRAKESPTEADEAKRDEINTSLSVVADRRLNSLRKNHTETRAIEESFADIREEMVNNRVDTSTMLERIDGGILTPLHRINEFDYPDVDKAIALFKLVHSRGDDGAEEIQTAISGLDRMLEQMAGILNEMRRRETFNELVKRLQSIREKQEEIRNKTKKAKVRSLIQGAFPGE